MSYALERLEDDPEMQRLVGMAALKKHLGVELPPEPDWIERLVREGVEGNPEHRDAFVKARLREEGAEFPEELDPIEEQIEKYEQLERLLNAIGGGQEPPSLVKELLLAVTEVLKIIRQVFGCFKWLCLNLNTNPQRVAWISNATSKKLPREVFTQRAPLLDISMISMLVGVTRLPFLMQAVLITYEKCGI